MDGGTSIIGAAVGVGVAIAGVAAQTVGFVFAAGTEIAPWAQVGGTATAVGALAYVAKLLADGKLVAQPVADLQRASEKREERLEELVQASHDREEALRAFLVGKAAGRG